MHDAKYKPIIIVGAGPGGLAVGAALRDAGIPASDLLILDKGEVGQAWLDYPAETHLLSESAEDFDHNMIANIPLKEVFPHIPHPSHVMYQRYLQEVVAQKELPIWTYTEIKKVTFDDEQNRFSLRTTDQRELECQWLIWAAGMFSTPSDDLESQKCYIHYAKVPDFESYPGKDLTVVGSGNGASGVVMALAKPGRFVRLLVPRTYDIPEPIDCLWKENMQFVKELELQGLVDIVPEFRVKTITKAKDGYLVTSTTDQEMVVPTKPIVCVGFEPTVGPLGEMVGCSLNGHDWALELTTEKEAKQQAGLFLAGTLGRREPEEAFIREFRNFGPIIAKAIKKRWEKQS
jgi:putative flavoprotein involved in K+ transport